MKQKAKIYIDGSNTFHAQKKLGWLIDWKKVKQYLAEKYDILGLYYYTGLKDADDTMKSFLRYLNKVGINATTKPLKKILLERGDPLFVHAKGGYIYKANFDVEITVDILSGSETVNRIIIFSGDSDFAYLVKKLKSLGKDVTIFSSRKTIAWELKLEKAKVVYLEDIENKIRRI